MCYLFFHFLPLNTFFIFLRWILKPRNRNGIMLRKEIANFLRHHHQKVFMGKQQQRQLIGEKRSWQGVKADFHPFYVGVCRIFIMLSDKNLSFRSSSACERREWMYDLERFQRVASSKLFVRMKMMKYGQRHFFLISWCRNLAALAKSRSHA